MRALRRSLIRALRFAADREGYDLQISRKGVAPQIPDASSRDVEIIERVLPFTMTGPERLLALIRGVEYVVANRIPGDLVECGVWRGGSMMAALFTLLDLGASDRVVHLFDTFQGMTAPRADDRTIYGDRADELLGNEPHRPGENLWCWATREEVEANVATTGYPIENVRFVEGDVADTVPSAAPDAIAILRLDTDWYESTIHELDHLYPRLSQGGLLIIDDYGHWQGARKAVDEYFAARDYRPLLHRIDYTARCLVKIEPR